MSRIFPVKRVMRSQKNRSCDVYNPKCCTVFLHKGKPYMRISGVVDGGFRTNTCCEACYESDYIQNSLPENSPKWPTTEELEAAKPKRLTSDWHKFGDYMPLQDWPWLTFRGHLSLKHCCESYFDYTKEKLYVDDFQQITTYARCIPCPEFGHSVWLTSKGLGAFPVTLLARWGVVIPEHVVRCQNT